MATLSIAIKDLQGEGHEWKDTNALLQGQFCQITGYMDKGDTIYISVTI